MTLINTGDIFGKQLYKFKTILKHKQSVTLTLCKINLTVDIHGKKQILIKKDILELLININIRKNSKRVSLC